jgi:hypothetical protein
MARTFNGTNQYLRTSSAPAIGFPMTLAAWCRSTSMTETRTVIAVGQAPAATRHRNQIELRTTGAISIGSIASPTTASAVTTATTAVNQWFHAAGVVASLSSRTIYLNGGNAVTNTATIGAYSTFTEMGIGAQQSFSANTYENFWAGDLAEVGVWNVALTSEEVASLGRGVTCDQVRPQSLVFYAPLVRDIGDMARGIALTNVNAATVSAHPRVYA